MTYTKNNITFGTKPSHPNFQDLTGYVYGHLTVIGYGGRPNGETLWFCECKCGTITCPRANYLRRGTTTSCGCQSSRHSIGQRSQTHGLSGTSEHSIWKTMISRCYNPNNKNFPRYGGRDIQMCDRWRSSFSHFLADMGNRPSKDHSIERIDNEADYTPDNCKWATRKEQANNRRSNHLLTYNGQTKNLTQWCTELGLVQSRIYARLQYGWDVHKAFTTPVRKSRATAGIALVKG